MALPTNITPGARVLIIDDDADCAFGLARMLKKTGYTAVRAMTDPTVALERFPARHTAELQTADLEKAFAGLRDTQQQVIQQERMRALDTMAAGIAHDLNNGLSIILGYGQMLLTDSNSFPAESEARDKLEKIMMAGNDNATLVKRLSAFHRPSDTLENLEPIDL